MKRMKNIATILLAILLLGCSTACSCKKEKPVDNTQAVNPNHSVTVTETDDYLVRNGRSDYKILLPENPSEVLEFAAQELNYFYKETTGASLEIVNDTMQTEWNKVLSIGNTSVAKSVGVTVPYDVYGGDGYKIVNDDKSVVMLGGGDFGSLYAVYDFVEYNLKAKVYANDEILINKAKTIKLMSFVVNEIPDIERRAISSYYATNSQAYRRRMRLVGNADNWTYWTHSHFALMPKETYYEEHPEYYSPDGTQLCLTNDGMIAQMVKNVIAHLEATSTDEYITLGQQDVNSFCSCESCRPAVAKYKESGVMIRFINRVASEVQAYFDGNGSNRKINFATYAYQKTQSAPVTISDGVYTALDTSVKPNDNVAVIIAPLTACYSHSLLDAECNTLAKQTIEGWASLGTKLYMRFYSAQYAYYCMPFMGYSTLAKNYNDSMNIGAKYIFDTAVGESRTTGFDEMLAYVKAELMWDTTVDTRALMDDFMKNYYKDAHEPMKELFNMYETQWAILEGQGYHYIPSTSIGISMFNNATVFPRSLLSAVERLASEALEKIAHLKETDETLYYKLKNRIESERVAALYWQVELHKQYFTKSELATMIDDFERICNAVGIDRWAEYNAAAGQDKSVATLVSNWRTSLL